MNAIIKKSLTLSVVRNCIHSISSVQRKYRGPGFLTWEKVSLVNIVKDLNHRGYDLTDLKPMLIHLQQIKQVQTFTSSGNLFFSLTI